jgi:hypothetical protein
MDTLIYLFYRACLHVAYIVFLIVYGVFRTDL